MQPSVPEPLLNWKLAASPSVRMAIVPITTIFVLALALTTSAQAQMYTVRHSFTDQGDGGHPDAGVTVDAAGNLYGTAPGGGARG